ncbi:MAG: hypothetical protein ACJ71J_09640 [Nitrososphaeraceae archaeon]
MQQQTQRYHQCNKGCGQEIYFDVNNKSQSGKFMCHAAQNTEDKREKIHALALAKECYSMKLDLLTNATVVDDAIRFVSQKSNEKVKSSNSSRGDKEESNESDYNEDKDSWKKSRKRKQER